MTVDLAFDRTDVRFDESGLVPGVVQDVRTGSVLMVAWLNDAALAATIETGLAHFWSRSRQELWKKGETSGNTLSVERLSIDCDNDTLLISADPSGPVCHTGSRTCFDRIASATLPVGFAELESLWATIEARVRQRPAGSYTIDLIDGGPERTGRKVLEEAAEVVEAALEHRSGVGSDTRVAAEAGDLVYHLLVLLAERGFSPSLVMDQLAGRRGRPTRSPFLDAASPGSAQNQESR